MKFYTTLKSIFFFVLLSFIFTINLFGQNDDAVNFHVNLNDLSDDTFKVVVDISNLDEVNNVFQFASTAPGTYQTMNIGRFVNGFKAYNKKGKEIKTEQISINQYQLESPHKITRIEYTISDIWDTKVDSNRVYRMCGTSMEKDHVLINGQGVFGYFKGMQSKPITINLEYPEEWEIGTALIKNEDGLLVANSFDHLVDSPILLGRLSKASTDINGTIVDIFTYSKTDRISSDQILHSMEEMLQAASKYLQGLPVDKYTFLFHFEDKSEGAWEHSYSSTYILHEDDWENLAKDVKEIAAHEFFHIVTPLNIHSEVIEKFNFVTPVTSDHLWLYEGTTEWAANMMLFRSGQISLSQYLDVLHKKAEQSDRHYDNSISLVELARNSFTIEGQRNYGNIYQKGALVAELLNLRLLELSKGKFGLREVIIKLAKEYGPNKPFDEKSFFKEFTNETFPEIEDFFNRYVMGSEALPFTKYFSKIGIKYIASEKSKTKTKFPYSLRLIDEKLVVQSVTNEGKLNGIEVGDIILSVDGNEVNMPMIYKMYRSYSDKKLGTPVQLVLERNGKKLNVQTSMVEKIDSHIFIIDPDATKDQIDLRENWMSAL